MSTGNGRVVTPAIPGGSTPIVGRPFTTLLNLTGMAAPFGPNAIAWGTTISGAPATFGGLANTHQRDVRDADTFAYNVATDTVTATVTGTTVAGGTGALLWCCVFEGIAGGSLSAGDVPDVVLGPFTFV